MRSFCFVYFCKTTRSPKSGSCPITVINNFMSNKSKVESYIFRSLNQMTQHSNFPVRAACDTASCWNASTLHNASHLAAHHKTAAASVSSVMTSVAGRTRVNSSMWNTWIFSNAAHHSREKGFTSCMNTSTETTRQLVFLTFTRLAVCKYCYSANQILWELTVHSVVHCQYHITVQWFCMMNWNEFGKVLSWPNWSNVL
jgi:trehalose-6-phosphate synthase